MATTYPTRPRKELVIRAMRVMGTIGNDQDADNDDYRVVDALVEPLLARIDAEDITTIDDPDAIPAAQFMDVAVLLAEAAMGDFGLSSLPPPHDPRASEVRLRTVVSVAVTMEDIEVADPDTGVVTTEERPQTLIGEYY